MLDKLPQELIVAITDHLGMHDKLILIKTCRHVFNMVSGSNLFSELDILECNEKTLDIIVKFKDNPSFGAQVKLLSISEVYISDDFSTIFPNVTRVTTRKPSWHQLQPLEDYSKCPMVHWSKTLKEYNSRSGWPEAIPVLKTTVFPQLTELLLGRANEFGDKNEGFDIPYFLPVFKNVPSLKKLTLLRTPIDLEFLDEIHANCPHLESLTVIFSHIIIKNRTLNQPIRPADSLLHLNLCHVFCIDTNGLFLDYITSKYRHLKKLEVFLERYRQTHEFLKAYDPDAVQCAINRPVKPEYMTVYQSIVDDFKSTLAIYKVFIPRFFSHLATIDSIIVEKDVFENTLEALAETKVSRLEYRDTLADSKQLQHIRHIRSLKTLHIRLKFTRSFQVVPLTGITELHLSNCGDQFYIDWLLGTFPSLKELYLYDNFTVAETISDGRFPNLFKFVSRADVFDQKRLDYLKIIAPNITVLELSTRQGLDGLDISGWNLKKLKPMAHNMEFNENYCYGIKSPHVNQVIKHNPVEKRVVQHGCKVIYG